MSAPGAPTSVSLPMPPTGARLETAWSLTASKQAACGSCVLRFAILHSETLGRAHRLAVATAPSYGANRGSISPWAYQDFRKVRDIEGARFASGRLGVRCRTPQLCRAQATEGIRGKPGWLAAIPGDHGQTNREASVNAVSGSCSAERDAAQLCGVGIAAALEVGELVRRQPACQ